MKLGYLRLLMVLGWGLFIWLFFSVGFANFFKSLAEAIHLQLIMGLLLFIGAQFLRGLKWRMFFDEKLSNFEGIRLYLSNLSYSIFSPLRTADFLLMRYLKKEFGISYKRSGFLILLDKIMDASIIGSIAAVGLGYFLYKHDLVGQIDNRDVYGFIAVGILLVLASYFIVRLARFQRVIGAARKFLKEGQRIKKILLIYILSVASLVAEISAGYIIIDSVFHLAYKIYFLTKPISMAIGMLSMVPSGIGIESYSIIQLLSSYGYWGIKLEAAILFARVLTMGTVVLLGQLFFYFGRKRPLP